MVDQGMSDDWRIVPHTQGRYEMHRDGRVRHVKSGRIATVHADGHYNTRSALGRKPERLYCMTWHTPGLCECVWDHPPSAMHNRRKRKPLALTPKMLATLHRGYEIRKAVRNPHTPRRNQ